MSVAKVTEISSTSTKSFEDAINVGLERANKTIRNIRSAWIKEQQVRLDQGKIVEYQVNMMVTFILED
jgi:flavin-binding protein dodecin